MGLAEAYSWAGYGHGAHTHTKAMPLFFAQLNIDNKNGGWGNNADGVLKGSGLATHEFRIIRRKAQRRPDWHATSLDLSGAAAGAG